MGLFEAPAIWCMMCWMAGQEAMYQMQLVADVAPSSGWVSTPPELPKTVRALHPPTPSAPRPRMTDERAAAKQRDIFDEMYDMGEWRDKL